MGTSGNQFKNAPLAGWRPGSEGAAPALRRILHYPLADLLAAAHAGGTLADLTKA